jgi:hypothetical protein
MAVTPIGSPAWARTITFDDYGGDVNKANYQSQGAINPRTDVTAEQFSRLVEDLTGVVRVADFAKLYVTCNDSSPAAPTIQWCRMMSGVRSTSYEGDAAPTGFPAGARVGDGSITLTFDASYSDAYGVSQALTIEHVSADGADTSVAYVTKSVAGSVVTLAAFDDTGAAVADAEFTVEVS